MVIAFVKYIVGTLVYYGLWAFLIIGVLLKLLGSAHAGPLTNEQAQRIFDQAFPPYLCQFWIKGMRDPFAKIRIDLDRPGPWVITRKQYGMVLTRGNVEIVVNYSAGFRDGGSAVLRIDGKDDTDGVCEKER